MFVGISNVMTNYIIIEKIIISEDKYKEIIKALICLI